MKTAAYSGGYRSREEGYASISLEIMNVCMGVCMCVCVCVCVVCVCMCVCVYCVCMSFQEKWEERA